LHGFGADDNDHLIYVSFQACLKQQRDFGGSRPRRVNSPPSGNLLLERGNNGGMGQRFQPQAGSFVREE